MGWEGMDRRIGVSQAQHHSWFVLLVINVTRVEKDAFQAGVKDSVPLYWPSIPFPSLPMQASVFRWQCSNRHTVLTSWENG